MVEDVYEPLARYRDEYRKAFAKNASEMFDELVAQSAVDSEANARTIREKASLENSRNKLKGRLAFARICTYGLWLLAAYSLWRAYGCYSSWQDGLSSGWAWLRLILWAAGGVCVCWDDSLL